MYNVCVHMSCTFIVTEREDIVCFSSFRFVEKLLFLLPVFQGVFRSMCLEVLLSQADIRPTLYQELKDKSFHDMLQFR